MSDELSTRLQRYLELTKNAEEFSEFYKLSKTGFEEAQAGNGWDPEKIQEELIKLKYIPLDDALSVAEQRKTKPFSLLYGLLRKARSDAVNLIGKMLCWFPYWIVSGYHMCFYFRGATYKVPVSDDVLAVHLGGKVRDVHMQDRPFNGATLISEVRRQGNLKNEGSAQKQIVLSGDATELAYHYMEGSLYLDMYGREDENFKNLIMSSPRTSKIKHFSNLKVKGLRTDITRSVESKAGIVKRLLDRTVHPPTAFQSILENRFEVTKLQTVFLPVYVFHYQYKDQIKEIRINSVTGQAMKR